MKKFTIIPLLLALALFPAWAQQSGQRASGGSVPPKGAVRPASRVAIRVLDKLTLRPIRATIMLVGKQPGMNVSPRFEDGMYQFRLTAADTCIVSIHADGYEMLTESIPASKLVATKVFYLTAKDPVPMAARHSIQPDVPILDEGITTVLHFPQSEADILPENRNELEILADFLNRHESSRIELSGHTDNVGDPLKNMLLSYDRVDEVRRYLTTRQISSSRIRGKGFGSLSPVAPNDCEANKRLNRRVEIRITL